MWMTATTNGGWWATDTTTITTTTTHGQIVTALFPALSSPLRLYTHTHGQWPPRHPPRHDPDWTGLASLSSLLDDDDGEGGPFCTPLFCHDPTRRSPQRGVVVGSGHTDTTVVCSRVGGRWAEGDHRMMHHVPAAPSPVFGWKVKGVGVRDSSTRLGRGAASVILVPSPQRPAAGLAGVRGDGGWRMERVREGRCWYVLRLHIFDFIPLLLAGRRERDAYLGR
ncbi:hypothetical protein IWZ01DRAFT_190148 [Phyllosticta capitalensis]